MPHEIHWPRCTKDSITASILTSTGKPKFGKDLIKDSESKNLSEPI